MQFPAGPPYDGSCAFNLAQGDVVKILPKTYLPEFLSLPRYGQSCQDPCFEKTEWPVGHQLKH